MKEECQLLTSEKTCGENEGRLTLSLQIIPLQFPLGLKTSLLSDFPNFLENAMIAKYVR